VLVDREREEAGVAVEPESKVGREVTSGEIVGCERTREETREERVQSESR